MFPNFEKFTLMKTTETTTSDSTGNNTLLAVSGHFEISFKSTRKDTTVYFDVYKDDGKIECVMNVYKNRECELAYGGDFETCINKLHEYQAACATSKGEERKD